MTAHVARISKPGRGLPSVAAAIMFATVCAFGQTTSTPATGTGRSPSATEKLPEFEVATVKPNKTGSGMIRMMFAPDGIDTENTPLQMLLREAYTVEDYQIVGAPSWIKSDRFDIRAKVDGGEIAALKKLTRDQRYHMMQPLLEDRFKLKWHYETRELPVYALVLAKGGSKLKESAPLSGSDDKGKRNSFSMGNDSLKADGVPIALLIHLLSPTLGRSVVDKTSLTGNYDFTLKWTPDESGQAQTDSSGPSLFTAVQEQLGLKLEPGKGPVQVMIIDHIEQPTEN